MDHGDAVRLKATERYLLNELEPDQLDQFEEHLFDCHECALDVRAAAMFVSKARTSGSCTAGGPSHGSDSSPEGVVRLAASYLRRTGNGSFAGGNYFPECSGFPRNEEGRRCAVRFRFGLDQRRYS